MFSRRVVYSTRQSVGFRHTKAWRKTYARNRWKSAGAACVTLPSPPVYAAVPRDVRLHGRRRHVAAVGLANASRRIVRRAYAHVRRALRDGFACVCDFRTRAGGRDTGILCLLESGTRTRDDGHDESRRRRKSALCSRWRRPEGEKSKNSTAREKPQKNSQPAYAAARFPNGPSRRRRRNRRRRNRRRRRTVGNAKRRVICEHTSRFVTFYNVYNTMSCEKRAHEYKN